MFSSAARVIKSRIGRRFLWVLVGTVSLSITAIVGVAIFILSHSLERKDRELIELKSSELSARYEKGGLAALAKPDLWVIVRLQSKDGTILFQRVPSGEEGFDLSRLASFPEHPQSEPRVWFEIEEKGDEDVLIVLSQKLGDGSLLQVGRSSADREEQLQYLLTILIGVGFPILLLTAVAGIWLVDSALKPIRSFTRTLEALKDGGVSARVPETLTSDEISTLISLFNGLLDRIEKLIEGLRETVNHVAHDLRTPLTRFRMSAERALQIHIGKGEINENEVDALREAVESALESSERMLSLVDQVLEISRAEAGGLPIQDGFVRLDDLVHQAYDLYRDVAEEKQIQLEFEPGNPVLSRGDRTQLLRVVANLLDNALKYTSSGGRVRIRTGSEPGERWLTISDTGMGISEQDLPKVWARLFRCDRSRTAPGLGLGLSWVKAVVEAHQGTVSVESALDQGSCFRVSFPA